MEVNVYEMHRATLLEITGRVDSTTAGKLGETLSEQIDAGRYQLVVDLSKCEYMSSAGLRELVSAVKRARLTNGDVRIATPSPRVKEVLTLAGLDTVFQIFDTQVEAVGSY